MHARCGTRETEELIYLSRHPYLVEADAFEVTASLLTTVPAKTYLQSRPQSYLEVYMNLQKPAETFYEIRRLIIVRSRMRVTELANLDQTFAVRTNSRHYGVKVFVQQLNQRDSQSNEDGAGFERIS